MFGTRLVLPKEAEILKLKSSKAFPQPTVTVAGIVSNLGYQSSRKMAVQWINDGLPTLLWILEIMRKQLHPKAALDKTAASE